MAGNSELERYKFSESQSALGPTPTRMASAVNIIPTTKMTVLSGTASLAAIGTIVAAATNPTVPKHIVPVQEGYHELVLLFTNANPGIFTVTAYPDGNIAVAYTPIVNRPIRMYYDPVTHLYYPAAVI